MSKVIVAYKSLDFLGYHDYRVGDDGSVWSRRNKSLCQLNVTPEDVPKIKRLRAAGMALNILALRFKCRQQTISRVLRDELFVENKLWRRMHPSRHPKGHLVVALCDRLRHKSFYVHQLVLFAFVGPRPEGMEARHFPDRNPSNNKLENLQWGTKEENEADKIVHGTSNRGERQGRSRFTEAEVIAIRKRHSDGERSFIIARQFNVPSSTIRSIVNRYAWRHIL